MSVISDSIKAMKEVLLLTDKVEQAGGLLSDISKELRDHDKRIIKLETRLDTYAEVASIQSGNRLEKK